MPEERTPSQELSALSSVLTPSIRTMKTDAELLSTAKKSTLTLGDLVSQSEHNRPQEKKKNPATRVAAAIGTGIFVLLVGGGLLLLAPRVIPSLRPSLPLSSPASFAPPPAPFSTEREALIRADTAARDEFSTALLGEILSPQPNGTTKRLAIALVDGPEERLFTFADFLDMYRIVPPPGFLAWLHESPFFFSHYISSGPRFGIAVKTKNSDRVLRGMLQWEPALPQAFMPFFLGAASGFAVAPFEDHLHRNIDIRFLPLSAEEDLGIGYALFPAKNVLLIATSYETLTDAIDRLFKAE